jgi:hypothetical protein
MTPTDHTSTFGDIWGKFESNVYGGRYQYVPIPWEVNYILDY